MALSLLRTKLYIPPARLEWVQRARLIERLSACLVQGCDPSQRLGFGYRLTLVSAPAGFGKTTLLSEWVRSIREPVEGGSPVPPHVAWVSLDAGDNDLARFLAYVIVAIEEAGIQQESGSHVGKGLLDALQAPGGLPVEELLTALINQISAAAGRLVLILDDYHVIIEPSIHDRLVFLLESLPPQMHLVIATRADPPLPLAHLRARGQLSELRQSDLRFTNAEAAAFLNRVMGLELTEEDVAFLAARTEGWIAALHLAALQMTSLSAQGRAGQQSNAGVLSCARDQGDDAGAFIRAFTGSDRFILDYLMGEVFSRQPEHIQTFLLHTAVLSRLSAPICDAVLGHGVRSLASIPPESGRETLALSSQDILEWLERANLFVVPLDNERRWYRYHHLFADLLRQRLEQTQPEMATVLHGRAGAWCEQNGLVGEAIEHALAAGDHDWATVLVEREAESIVMRSELATLRRWIRALPEDMVRARPLLCIFDTWALLVGGQSVEAVEARLQDALDADSNGAFTGEVWAIRALIAAFQHKTRKSVELSQRALDLLPEERTFFRSFIAGYLGLNHMYSGDLDSARRAFEEAVRLAQKIGNVMNAVLGLVHLAELSAIEGHLHQARTTYERALELAVNGNGRRLPVAGVALTGLGRLLQLSNELEKAQRCLDEGIDLVSKWAEAGAIGGYVGRAMIRQSRGDESGAQAAIQTAEDLALRFDAMRSDDEYVAVNKATLNLLQGNLQEAERWAEGRDLEDRPGGSLLGALGSSDCVPLNRVYEYLTLAELRLAQGRHDEALALVRSLRRETEAIGWGVFTIRALVLESVALYRQGRSRQALDALGRALALAEPEGYVRAFIDKGPDMAQLLYQAAAQGLSPRFAGRLLAEFEVPGAGPRIGVSPVAGSRATQANPQLETLIEPLSEREVQVLALIAEGLTNREVAQRLHVSLSTVKVHTYNMYGKLDVHSRTQAVVRARALGVLDPL